MNQDRRSILAAIGLALPLGITDRAGAAHISPTPRLHFQSFEDSVRKSFEGIAPTNADVPGEVFPTRRIEVGHSDGVALQGCHNDRAFAGFPAGHLRIIRTGSAAGAIVQGVRLYVATVEIALTRGGMTGETCPLDFATVPPAPMLTYGSHPKELARMWKMLQTST